MTEYTEDEDYDDAAHGEGSYGLSNDFFNRVHTKKSKPRSIKDTWKVGIPEDVDHYSSDKDLAESIARRKFNEEYDTGYTFTKVEKKDDVVWGKEEYKDDIWVVTVATEMSLLEE